MLCCFSFTQIIILNIAGYGNILYVKLSFQQHNKIKAHIFKYQIMCSMSCNVIMLGNIPM